MDCRERRRAESPDRGFIKNQYGNAGFKSVSGRRRTQPGRELVNSHAEGLNDLEWETVRLPQEGKGKAR
jgi:hypothetical protein